MQFIVLIPFRYVLQYLRIQKLPQFAILICKLAWWDHKLFSKVYKVKVYTLLFMADIKKGFWREGEFPKNK